MATTTYPVTGMTCEHCVNAVTSELGGLDGVSAVTVDLVPDGISLVTVASDAGALDAGLKVAKGEFIAIFDADFVPPPDWLMKVIHHFAEPEIGMVQTRWTYLRSK